MYSENLTFWCFDCNKPEHLREEGESIRMRKLLNEPLERNRLFWFLMLAVIKIFQIEKFLKDFVFSSISSLNISAFYM